MEETPTGHGDERHETAADADHIPGSGSQPPGVGGPHFAPPETQYEDVPEAPRSRIPMPPQLSGSSETLPRTPLGQRQIPYVPDEAQQQWEPNQPSVGMALLFHLLFTGAGQMYNKQVGKGFFFLLVSFVMFLLVGALEQEGFIVFAVVNWIIALVDAARIARRRARGEHVGQWQFF